MHPILCRHSNKSNVICFCCFAPAILHSLLNNPDLFFLVFIQIVNLSHRHAVIIYTKCAWTFAWHFQPRSATVSRYYNTQRSLEDKKVYLIDFRFCTSLLTISSNSCVWLCNMTLAVAFEEEKNPLVLAWFTNYVHINLPHSQSQITVDSPAALSSATAFLCKTFL